VSKKKAYASLQVQQVDKNAPLLSLPHPDDVDFGSAGTLQL